MIIIFTGNGKGKTTAALGQAVRSVGEGRRTLMIQFIKGPWKSGEDLFFEKYGIRNSEFRIIKTGLGFVGILGDAFPREKHAEAAQKGLELARKEMASGRWDIVILDEINNAVSLGLVSKEDVLELLEGFSRKLQAVILTGRDAPKEFIDKADLVTDMQDIKHPYEKGLKARRGLEY